MRLAASLVGSGIKLVDVDDVPAVRAQLRLVGREVRENYNVRCAEVNGLAVVLGAHNKSVFQ